MMKGYAFCPNCFQTGTYNGYICKACGYIQEQKDKYALPPGTRLKERYLLGRVLGVGGFGITYLAFDPASGRLCALKEYFPRAWAVRDNATNSLMPTTEGQQEVYRHGRDVFINEAKILQGLYANPHVVNVLDFFYDNKTAYMVMEYIQGQTINVYMKKKKHTVSIRMANQMLREIGEALEQIHQNMLLHRDISPDNIMITPNGQFKLIDFGATRTYALSNPLSMSIFVKPGFAPIEQYSRTGHQGPWTDIYALCATYYYMVTGEKPPSAPDRQNGIRLTPLAYKNSNVSASLSRAVERGMRKNYRERQKTVSQFLEETGINNTNTETVTQNGQAFLCLQNQQNAVVGKWPFSGMQLTIGRKDSGVPCDIYLNDSQISSRHCMVTYNPANRQFSVTNYSGNHTYVRDRILEKGQTAYLKPGDWFYMQTKLERFIFFVEVQ